MLRRMLMNQRWTCRACGETQPRIEVAAVGDDDGAGPYCQDCIDAFEWTYEWVDCIPAEAPEEDTLSEEDRSFLRSCLIRW